jgi:putative phage-type endonuclease
MSHEIELIDFPQRSEEWHAARLGLITASKASRMIDSTGKRSASFNDLVNELVSEVITKASPSIFVNEAMQDGIDREPVARSMFEFIHDCEVAEATFVKIVGKRIGCSPDGVIKNGKFTGHLLEIKCPAAKTHVKYLRAGKLPTAYIAQCQLQMYVCKIDKLQFMSYHPDMEPLIVEVPRDEAYILKLHDLLEEVSNSVEKLSEELRRK